MMLQPCYETNYWLLLNQLALAEYEDRKNSCLEGGSYSWFTEKEDEIWAECLDEVQKLMTAVELAVVLKPRTSSFC